MQVERVQQCISGERVSNTLVTCPKDGNITWKRVAKPNKLDSVREGQVKAKATLGGACGPSVSW